MPKSNLKSVLTSLK